VGAAVAAGAGAGAAAGAAAAGAAVAPAAVLAGIADDAVLVPLAVAPMLGVLPMQRVLSNLERPGRPAPRGRVCLIAFLAVIVPIHVAAPHVRMSNGVVIVTGRPGVILGDGRDERRGDQGEQYHQSAHRSLRMSERLPEEGALRPQ